MTEEEIRQHKVDIDKMTQKQMARLHRFAPSGHPYFRTDLPLYVYFEKRFAELGGWTSEISKEIGW